MTLLRDARPFDDMHEDRNGHQHVDVECFECQDCGHMACCHVPEAEARNCFGECDKPGCECPEAVIAEDLEKPAAVAS